MSRKKSLFQTELDKRVSKADDGGKQRYTVEDEYAHIETTEGHLESSGIRSLRRGRKKSKFQIESDRLMSEAEEEQTSCATADPDTETNSLSMTKGLLIDEAELSGKYTYKVIT